VALKYIKLAVAQGDALGQFCWGKLLQVGDGVAKNLVEAAKCQTVG
jgi:TPR repeat protein